MLTTEQQVRRQFWLDHPNFSRAKHNLYIRGKHAYLGGHCDTRCAFADYVDHLQRSGVISEALAQRVTL